MRGLSLEFRRACAHMPRGSDTSGSAILALELLDHLPVLGMDDGKAVACRHLLHRSEDDVIGKCIRLVVHEELEAGKAARGDCGNLGDPVVARFSKIDVQAVVDQRGAGGLFESAVDAVSQ